MAMNAHPARRQEAGGRESGALMLEMTLAVTVLAIGALAFLSSFHANSLALNTVNQIDEAASAVSNVAEELTGVPLDEVYANYHGRTIPVPALTGATGEPAGVEVICHVDENAIPAAFGPLTDLDGNPGSSSSDVSASYELLPVELRLTYVSADGLRTQQVFMVLGMD